MNLAGKSAQAQADKLTKKVELGTKDVDTALGLAKLESEERQAGIYAQSRQAGAGNRFTYEEAITKARTQMPFDAFQQTWITSGESKRTGRAMPTQEDYDRALDGLARSILARNEAYYSGTTAAPSGGGAQPVIDFRTGKPIGQ